MFLLYEHPPPSPPRLPVCAKYVLKGLVHPYRGGRRRVLVKQNMLLWLAHLCTDKGLVVVNNNLIVHVELGDNFVWNEKWPLSVFHAPYRYLIMPRYELVATSYAM